MKRIIVGISGASGVELGHRVLEALHALPGIETHLVISEGAHEIFRRESDADIDDVEALADHVYDNHDMGAAISSGSYMTDGMIVAPCSMKSLAAIACAFDDDLLVRAADVCRKEGRKVVLVPRECPLSPAHLRNMLQVAEDGYTVLPPVLSFYNGAKTTEEQVDHIVGKILMQFGLPYDKFHPWEG